MTGPEHYRRAEELAARRIGYSAREMARRLRVPGPP